MNDIDARIEEMELTKHERRILKKARITKLPRVALIPILILILGQSALSPFIDDLTRGRASNPKLYALVVCLFYLGCFFLLAHVKSIELGI